MIRITQLKLPIEHKGIIRKNSETFAGCTIGDQTAKDRQAVSRCQKKGADLIYLYRRCGSGKRAADLKESEK